jgi:hypothetical protein
MSIEPAARPFRQKKSRRRKPAGRTRTKPGQRVEDTSNQFETCFGEQHSRAAFFHSIAALLSQALS